MEQFLKIDKFGVQTRKTNNVVDPSFKKVPIWQVECIREKIYDTYSVNQVPSTLWRHIEDNL